MSRETGLSPASVMRIWHAFGIKPHLEKTFKLSTDPLFVDKVHDIVGLYLNPPDRAVVPCIDEKSQIPLLRKHRHYLIHGTVSKTHSKPPLCLADAVGLIKDVVAVPSPVAFNDLGQSDVFVAFHP